MAVVPLSRGVSSASASDAVGNSVRPRGRRIFAPDYFFIAMMALLIGTGLWKLFGGGLPSNASEFPLPQAEPSVGLAYIFLLLRAFASGGAAVTGVEAISNGVPAFKPPEWRNARTTLMWMGVILGTLFFLSIFATHMHIAGIRRKGDRIAQIGGRVRLTVSDGPVCGPSDRHASHLGALREHELRRLPLASFHAGDHFLPRQLTRYETASCLNGIIALATVEHPLWGSTRASAF